MVTLNTEGECQVAIVDITRQVDGKYPILGTSMIPHFTLGMMLESLRDRLAELVEKEPDFEGCTVEESVGALLGLLPAIDQFNEQAKRRHLEG